MSETETPQREIEVVSGVIEGVTQKKPDTWQVVVRPDGSQYTKNLWTKDAELVTSLTAKLGQHGGFVCSASYWNRQDGQQVRSLWINAEGEAAASSAVETVQTRSTPAAAPKAQGDGLSKEEWARKDRAADLRACIAIASSALQHTVKSEPSDADLNEFARRTLFVARQFHGVVSGERAGGEDVPFLSEHDQNIPF